MIIIWMECCATSSMIGAPSESGRYEKLLFYTVLVSGHVFCAHCAMGGFAVLHCDGFTVILSGTLLVY